MLKSGLNAILYSLGQQPQKKPVTIRQLFRYHHNKPDQYSIWCYTEASEEWGIRVKLPSPPSARPLGQGRAEPQAQTRRGCCQLLKVQGWALPGHESPTPFFSSTRTPWALPLALNTHRLLGVTSLPKSQFIRNFIRDVFQCIYFVWLGRTHELSEITAVLSSRKGRKM